MIDDSIEELRELAFGAGADVVGSVVQNLPRPARTYLGRGKLRELMAVVGMFNQTNRLANGYQIEVDEQYISTG